MKADITAPWVALAEAARKVGASMQRVAANYCSAAREMARVPRLEPELEIRALSDPEGHGTQIEGLMPYQREFMDRMAVPEAIVNGGNRHSRERTASEIAYEFHRRRSERVLRELVQLQTLRDTQLQPGPSFTLTVEQAEHLPDDLKAKIKKPPEPVVSITSPFEFAPPPGTRRFA